MEYTLQKVFTVVMRKAVEYKTLFLYNPFSVMHLLYTTVEKENKFKSQN